MTQQTPTYAYFNGQIVPIAEARISVMTHAFNYGTAVFGGLRGYYNDDQRQMYIFRPYDHFKRLLNSAKLLRMDIGKTPEELTEILRELIRTEDYHENIYVRPLVYKANEMIGVKLHDLEDAFTMFCLPFGRYVQKEEGLHVAFSAWRRVDDNAIPVRGKVTGAYVNSALAKSDAILSGYDEALVLNQDGHLSEGSAANIMMVRDGVLITPPVNSNILEGITHRTLIHLAREELGLDVVERDIDHSEVYIADEVFMCGTGIQVAAVTRIEHRDIGSGRMGDITRQIRKLYFDVVNGRVEKYHDWLTPVYTKEPIDA